MKLRRFGPGGEQIISDFRFPISDFEDYIAQFQIWIQAAGKPARKNQSWWGERPREPLASRFAWPSPARGDAHPTSQKFADGFPGVLTANANDQDGYVTFTRRNFPKRHGFFFQGKTDECGHLMLKM
jgi:hypothetical protein